jgi:hypothetical protein
VWNSHKLTFKYNPPKFDNNIVDGGIYIYIKKGCAHVYMYVFPHISSPHTQQFHGLKSQMDFIADPQSQSVINAWNLNEEFFDALASARPYNPGIVRIQHSKSQKKPTSKRFRPHRTRKKKNKNCSPYNASEEDEADFLNCIDFAGMNKRQKSSRVRTDEQPQTDRSGVWSQSELKAKFQSYLTYWSTGNRCVRPQCTHPGAHRVKFQSGSGFVNVCSKCIKRKEFESVLSVNAVLPSISKSAQTCLNPPPGVVHVSMCKNCGYHRSDNVDESIKGTMMRISLSGKRHLERRVWRCPECEKVCGSDPIEYGFIPGLDERVVFDIDILSFCFHLRVHTQGGTSTKALTNSILGVHGDNSAFGFSWSGT